MDGDVHDGNFLFIFFRLNLPYQSSTSQHGMEKDLQPYPQNQLKTDNINTILQIGIKKLCCALIFAKFILSNCTVFCKQI